MAELGRVQADPKDAAQITHSALAGSCSLSRGVLAMFCAFLGSIAGNVALTFGARGGCSLPAASPSHPRVLARIGVPGVLRGERPVALVP